jgi:excisionase family DNA binding protein
MTLLTPDEAAAMLGVPRSRVLALIRARALGAVHLGPRTVRIRQEDIDRLVAEVYRGPDGQAEGPRQRAGQRLPSPRTPAPVVRERHDRVDPRRASGPPVPLRRIEG